MKQRRSSNRKYFGSKYNHWNKNKMVKKTRNKKYGDDDDLPLSLERASRADGSSPTLSVCSYLNGEATNRDEIPPLQQPSQSTPMAINRRSRRLAASSNLHNREVATYSSDDNESTIPPTSPITIERQRDNKGRFTKKVQATPPKSTQETHSSVDSDWSKTLNEMGRKDREQESGRKTAVFSKSHAKTIVQIINNKLSGNPLTSILNGNRKRNAREETDFESEDDFDNQNDKNAGTEQEDAVDDFDNQSDKNARTEDVQVAAAAAEQVQGAAAEQVQGERVAAAEDGTVGTHCEPHLDNQDDNNARTQGQGEPHLDNQDDNNARKTEEDFDNQNDKNAQTEEEEDAVVDVDDRLDNVPDSKFAVIDNGDNTVLFFGRKVNFINYLLISHFDYQNILTLFLLLFLF